MASAAQILLAEAEREIERLRKIEWAAKEVLDTFRKSEAAGYRTKDRQYAIEILGKFVDH
jgi:hypothetical protein